jgi:hypothetical protein
MCETSISTEKRLHVPVIPAMVGSRKWGTIVQDGLSKKQDSTSNITRAAGGVAQVVEHLPGKC